MAASENKRFICDDHLGKLARYLRVGGFDTAFDQTISDTLLIQLSLDESRIILTRDTRLVKRTLVRDFYLITDDRWRKQLISVIARFNLEFKRSLLLSRCLEDNYPTESVSREEISNLVYPYTYESHDEFRRCPHCRRVYWAGTHVQAILNNLTEAGVEIIE